VPVGAVEPGDVVGARIAVRVLEGARGEEVGAVAGEVVDQGDAAARAFASDFDHGVNRSDAVAGKPHVG